MKIVMEIKDGKFINSVHMSDTCNYHQCRNLEFNDVINFTKTVEFLLNTLHPTKDNTQTTSKKEEQ